MNLGPSVASPIPGPFRGSPGPYIETITGEGHNGDFTDPDLDRFIFSPVHYAVVLYSLLVEVGRLDLQAFKSYNQDGSTVELIGAEHSPGHAVTAGSLAQAVSQAAGIAYARKLKGHRGRVIVYMSDGEFQEGQTWEAVQAMVFHKIANLTAVVDVNGQQCDGKMDDVCAIGCLEDKLASFGANVHRVDGHNIIEIEKAVKTYDSCRPTFVLCYTDPCRGFAMLRDRAPKLHYVRFKDTNEKSAWEKVLKEISTSCDITEITKPKRKKEKSTNKKRRFESGEQTHPRTKKHSLVVTEESKLSVKLEQSLETASAMFEIVTRPHRMNLVNWAKKHPRCITLTADLTSSCEADLLRDIIPNQYLSMGMAEQNMMSFAGGLAREGFHPFIQTFGVFITRRPFDQVAMSIGVPNLPVRLLGFLPGLTTPGGVTHQAIDDIALMRSIPNMRILEVGDATEVESVLDVADSFNGPVYVRMLRGEVPRLFPKTSPMKMGVPRILSDGADVAIISSGICTEEALKARQMILSSGVTIFHVHISTIVPFPSQIVLKAANRVKYGIITMENHSIVGGIGSATAEVMAENGCIGKKLVRLGVPGVYAHGATREYLMAEYKIDAPALIEAIGKLVGKKLEVSEVNHIGHKQAAGGLSVEKPEDL